MAISAKRRLKWKFKKGMGLETILDTAIVPVLVAWVVISNGLEWFAVLGASQRLITVPVVLLCKDLALHLFIALFVWAMVRGLAEHLRLQKKIAGIAFEGEISHAKEDIVWACGNCGANLTTENQCQVCGLEIEVDQVER